MEEDDRKNKSSAAYDINPEPNNALVRENNDFIGHQKGRQMEMIATQDQNLEHLGAAVDRLGQIGRDINTEVKEQQVLLDKLGDEIDENQTKLDVVQAALSKLLGTKDGCQIWTIVILGLVLILLVALVIWT
jgi:t-SNARE complex subunit (syntaxin)